MDKFVKCVEVGEAAMVDTFTLNKIYKVTTAGYNTLTIETNKPHTLNVGIPGTDIMPDWGKFESVDELPEIFDSTEINQDPTIAEKFAAMPRGGFKFYG